MLPLVTAAAIGTIGRVIEEAEKLKAAQQFGGIAQHMVPEAAAALSLISVLQVSGCAVRTGHAGYAVPWGCGAAFSGYATLGLRGANLFLSL